MMDNGADMPRPARGGGYGYTAEEILFIIQNCHLLGKRIHFESVSIELLPAALFTWIIRHIWFVGGVK